MKRQRGRGRGGKPGGGGHHHHNNSNPNRAMESSGPEGKVRGPAALIYERYLQAARDAASSGDRILSENFLQHADHYFRLLRQMQPAVQPQQQADRFSSGMESSFEGDEEGALSEGGEDVGAEEGEQVEAAEGEFGEERPQQNQQGERDGEFRRRGRGRRNRFRPEGEGEGAQAREDGGERREPRQPREPREPREPRGDREESREGFAGPGPKPAFLGSD